MKRSEITDEQWAEAKQQLLSALTAAARKPGYIYYSDLAKAVSVISLHYRSTHLHEMLDELAREFFDDARCLVTSVAVRKSKYSLQPGRRFFALAAKMGLYSADSAVQPAEFAREQRECARAYLTSR